MTRLIAESKFTESNYISRDVKLYSKAGPDIECPDACEKGKHTFEYSLYPHSGSWRKAFAYRRGWELNNPIIFYVITDLHSGQLPQEKSYLRYRSGNESRGDKPSGRYNSSTEYIEPY